MEFEFKVDNEIKQEYLQSKPTGTADSDAFVLREFDNYEDKVGKSVYNLSLNEINEMFAGLRNSSKRGVGKNKSILVSYIDFCVTKRIVEHMENRAKYIDIEKFVARQAMLNKYPTKEQLRQYSDRLFNAQDQLLLWLPFIGVKGRTIKGATMEEIVNLTIDDVFPNEHRLILRQNDGKFRELYDVDDFIFDIIKETYEQTEYVENNGEMTANPRIPDPRRSKINNTGEFSKHVFRTPGQKKFEKFSASLFNSRMKKIQRSIDNNYLTYTSLFFAGMLNMALNIYKEKGTVDKEDYIAICDRYNYYSSDPSQYWYILKGTFEDYLEMVK